MYHKKYLKLKLLVENVCKYELMGIYRPLAYLKGSDKYCTECQMELLKKPIEPGETAVVNAVLFAPHGFGDQLKQGSLLHLQNGLEIEAKAVVLEIMGDKQ